MANIIELRKRILQAQRAGMNIDNRGYQSFPFMPDSFYSSDQVKRCNEVHGIFLQSVEDLESEIGFNSLDLQVGREFLEKRGFMSPSMRKVRFNLDVYNQPVNIISPASNFCSIHLDYLAATRFSKDILELTELHPVLVAPNRVEVRELTPEALADYLNNPEPYYVLGEPRVPLEGEKINRRHIKTLLELALTDLRTTLPEYITSK